MAFMPNKVTIDDPDEQALGEIDPKIRDYLTKQMQSASAEQTPEYRQSIRQDVGAAADQKRSNNFAALLANSAAKIGQIGGKEADSSAMDQFAKQSNAGVDQSMDIEGMKPQGLDPKVLDYVRSRQNSQQMAKDRATALAQQAQQKIADRDATNQRAKEHNELMAQLGEGRRGDREKSDAEKADKQTDKDFDLLQSSLLGAARQGGASLQDEKNKLRVATHGKALLEGGNFDAMSPIVVQELGGIMAAQVQRGNPAQATLAHMTPETMQGDLAKAYQYITGKPAPANQGDFIKLFSDMLDRQTGTSADIIAGELGPVIANKKHLQKKDKIRYDDMLREAGVETDEKGNVLAYVPPYMKRKKDAPAPPPPGPAAVPGQAVAAPSGKIPVKKEFNEDTKKTRYTYQDGTTEVVDGRQ